MNARIVKKVTQLKNAQLGRLLVSCVKGLPCSVSHLPRGTKNHPAEERSNERSPQGNFRRPNPCYIPTLDATIVSCHLFDVFRQPQNKICLFKTIVCIVCIPLDLSYLTPKPLEPIEDEWR